VPFAAVLAALAVAAGCAGSGPTGTTAPSRPARTVPVPTSVVTPTNPPGTPSSPCTSHPTSTSPAISTSPATSTSPAPPTRPAPSTVPSWLLGTEWEWIPTTRHVVALTFDAGGDAAGVASILDTLQARKAPGTFFLTGEWTREHPVAARAIAAEYPVGNHSMTHPHFTELTDVQIRRQLRDAADAIRDVCGVGPAPLFRFPYGDRDARTIAVVNGSGYVAVRWTVDTLGWEGTDKGITVDSIIARVLDNLRPGEIVLMHVGANPDDGSTLDADALPRLIAALRGRGYGLVTLAALLRAQP
jgi:peptidoglycan/xylan/chitin deacetylase (PgdA/CDA1 family)